MEELVLIPYRKGNKWGYSDFDKNILIPCVYDWAKPFFEDRAVVCLVIDGRDSFGVIDLKGDIVCDFKYDGIAYFKNGFAGVRKDKKWGFIDKYGNEIVPTIYDGGVLPFICDRAVVMLNGNCFFIDTKGARITETIYDQIDSFINGYAPIKKGLLYGVIDVNGNEVIPCISRRGPVIFSEGLAAISIGNLEESSKHESREFNSFEKENSLENENDEAIDVEEFLATINDSDLLEDDSEKRRFGYVNTEGQTVIGFEFDLAEPFSEGLASVAVGIKYGFIDKIGSWVVEPIYEFSGDFKEGLARVMKNGKWGYINKRGEVVIDFLYDDAEDFNEGYARVVRTDPERNQGFRIIGLIDSKGEEIFYPSYCDDSEEEKDWTYAEVYHSEVRNGFIAFRDLDDTFFIHDIDTRDDKILPVNCIDVFPFENGIAEVVLRYAGNKVLPGYVGENWKIFWEDF